MTPQHLAIVISATAQEIFRQPSIPFDPTLAFREIPGFDSILAIQYVLAIEKALDVMLNEKDVDTMHTMGDLLTIIQAKQE